MQLSLIHRTTSFALLVVFFFFSVGIPIVQSLCPMMEATNEPCPMHEQGCVNQIAIGGQFGDCCATKIVAERSTTPFVKFEENKSVSLEPLFAIFQSESQFASHAPVRFAELVPRYESSSPPLFVLHSSLLI